MPDFPVGEGEFDRSWGEINEYAYKITMRADFGDPVNLTAIDGFRATLTRGAGNLGLANNVIVGKDGNLGFVASAIQIGPAAGLTLAATTQEWSAVPGFGTPGAGQFRPSTTDGLDFVVTGIFGDETKIYELEDLKVATGITLDLFEGSTTSIGSIANSDFSITKVEYEAEQQHIDGDSDADYTSDVLELAIGSFDGLSEAPYVRGFESAALSLEFLANNLNIPATGNPGRLNLHVWTDMVKAADGTTAFDPEDMEGPAVSPANDDTIAARAKTVTVELPRGVGNTVANTVTVNMPKEMFYYDVDNCEKTGCETTCSCQEFATKIFAVVLERPINANTDISIVPNIFEDTLQTTAADCAADCEGGGPSSTEHCDRCGKCISSCDDCICEPGVYRAELVVKGTAVLPCKDCGESDCPFCSSVVSPCTGAHTFGAWSVVTAPTCLVAGQSRRVCTACGFADTRTDAALGHDWDAVEVVEAPTCEDDGEGTQACKRDGCDVTREVDIDALGHDLGDDYEETKAPTCTVAGEGVGECQRAGCDYEGPVVIPALGHDWDDGEVTKAATCLAKGEMTFTCEREGCEETDVEDIDELGHDFGSDPDCGTVCARTGCSAQFKCDDPDCGTHICDTSDMECGNECDECGKKYECGTCEDCVGTTYKCTKCNSNDCNHLRNWKGDINDDGVVNMADAIIIMRNIARLQNVLRLPANATAEQTETHRRALEASLISPNATNAPTMNCGVQIFRLVARLQSPVSRVETGWWIAPANR
jgi:hypothetical protein